MAGERRTILITGGAGFVGSHLVRHWLKNYPQDIVLNLDALTYAGNLANTEDFKGCNNYHLVQGSITDESLINQLFDQYQLYHRADGHLFQHMSKIPCLFRQ